MRPIFVLLESRRGDRVEWDSWDMPIPRVGDRVERDHVVWTVVDVKWNPDARMVVLTCERAEGGGDG